MGRTRQLLSKTIAQIIALKLAGKQTKQIADQLGISDRVVRCYVARWKEGGCDAIPTQKKRSGRPRKTSRCVDNVVKRDLEKCPHISARKIKENNSGVLTKVSVRTVSRRVHELGYTSHRPMKKLILTRVQKARRVAYAQKYLQWDDDDWLDVLWSDEATFTVTEGRRRGSNVSQKQGSDPLDTRSLLGTVKHPSSLLVWGCFSGRSLGKLVVIPADIKVDQYVYYELLNEHLEECFELTGATVFQQDGAPCHSAKPVITWLKDCHINFIDDWPSNSPDLNPIENVWHLVKHGLQGKDVSTLPKLEKEIKASWDAIPTQKLHDLVMSMPQRLEDVIKYKGGQTKYSRSPEACERAAQAGMSVCAAEEGRELLSSAVPSQQVSPDMKYIVKQEEPTYVVEDVVAKLDDDAPGADVETCSVMPLGRGTPPSGRCDLGAGLEGISPAVVKREPSASPPHDAVAAHVKDEPCAFLSSVHSVDVKHEPHEDLAPNGVVEKDARGGGPPRLLKKGHEGAEFHVAPVPAKDDATASWENTLLMGGVVCGSDHTVCAIQESFVAKDSSATPDSGPGIGYGAPQGDSSWASYSDTDFYHVVM